MIDTLCQLVTAERLRLAEDMDCLEQAGFSRAIIAADEIESRIEIERGALQISEIGQAKLPDGHAESRETYSRIGMTTYRLELSWLSAMIALLFESLSFTWTFSESSTLSTSIR